MWCCLASERIAIPSVPLFAQFPLSSSLSSASISDLFSAFYALLLLLLLLFFTKIRSLLWFETFLWMREEMRRVRGCSFARSSNREDVTLVRKKRYSIHKKRIQFSHPQREEAGEEFKSRHKLTWAHSLNQIPGLEQIIFLSFIESREVLDSKRAKKDLTKIPVLDVRSRMNFWNLQTVAARISLRRTEWEEDFLLLVPVECR